MAETLALDAAVRKLVGAASAVVPVLGPEHASAALDLLAERAATDPRSARLYGVWLATLERRAGRRAGPTTSEDALLARFEDRLADIVAAMDSSSAAGDDARAQALHARYIELATSYATRLART